MKTKILNALKTEYANLGLGDKAFDGVAAFLEKTITDEAKIQDEIKTDLVKNLLKSIQGESDALRNRAAQAAKDLEDYKKLHPETTPPPTPPTPPTETENERKLREEMEQLKKRFDDAERNRTTSEVLTSVRNRLEQKEGCTNKGVLNSTLKGFALEKDETEDAAVTRLKEEYNRIYTETFGSGPIPPKGGGGTGDPKKEADAKNAWLREQGLLPKEETK